MEDMEDMEDTEARQRLEEYDRQAQRIGRRFMAPHMLFFAAYAFVFVLTGGVGSWLGNSLLSAVIAAWVLYTPRLTGVSWTVAQKRKFYAVSFVGFCWILACNAYVVNWNPRHIPLSGLVGGVLAAAPFLALARWYRP